MTAADLAAQAGATLVGLTPAVAVLWSRARRTERTVEGLAAEVVELGKKVAAGNGVRVRTNEAEITRLRDRVHTLTADVAALRLMGGHDAT